MPHFWYASEITRWSPRIQRYISKRCYFLWLDKKNISHGGNEFREYQTPTTGPLASIIWPMPVTVPSSPASARISSYVLCSIIVFTFFGCFQDADRFCSA